MKERISVAVAGLNRFYDEGFADWPEEKLRAVFCGAALDEEEIQQKLTEWEESGEITIIGMPDCFIRLRRPIST